VKGVLRNGSCAWQTSRFAYRMQLEEIDRELPKRWRLPNGLSGIFREPLADELAALHSIARRLGHDGLKESAALLWLTWLFHRRKARSIAIRTFLLIQ
jgi:hypothetical protein